MTRRENMFCMCDEHVFYGNRRMLLTHGNNKGRTTHKHMRKRRGVGERVRERESEEKTERERMKE